MGAINTTITLTNPTDPSKTHTMEALVDTGAVVLALPRDVVDFLGLDIFDQAVATLATGETTSLDVTGACRGSHGFQHDSRRLDFAYGDPFERQVLVSSGRPLRRATTNRTPRGQRP